MMRRDRGTFARRGMLAAAVLAAAALGLTGCVLAGATFPFQYQPPVGGSAGRGVRVVLLPVEDLRPQVRYEGEPAGWVGEQRDGFGIPFDVGTRDGRPLATIVEETLARDLEALGFEVVRAGERRDLAGALAAAGAERALAVTMHDFNSNTYLNTDVEWDLEALVHGADGRVLRRGHQQGHETIPGSSAGRRNERKVPDFFYRTLLALVVEDAELVAALAG